MTTFESNLQNYATDYLAHRSSSTPEKWANDLKTTLSSKVKEAIAHSEGLSYVWNYLKCYLFGCTFSQEIENVVSRSIQARMFSIITHAEAQHREIPVGEEGEVSPPTQLQAKQAAAEKLEALDEALRQEQLRAAHALLPATDRRDLLEDQARWDEAVNDLSPFEQQVQAVREAAARVANERNLGPL